MASAGALVTLGEALDVATEAERCGYDLHAVAASASGWLDDPTNARPVWAPRSNRAVDLPLIGYPRLAQVVGRTEAEARTAVCVLRDQIQMEAA